MYWNNCKHKHTQTSSISATAELNFRGLHIPVRELVTAYPSIPRPPALVYPAGWTGSYDDHHDRNWENIWGETSPFFRSNTGYSIAETYFWWHLSFRGAKHWSKPKRTRQNVLKGRCPCYQCEVIWPWFCLYKNFRLRIRRYSLNKKNRMQWQSTILKWSFLFSLQTTTQAKNAPKKRRPVFPYIMHPTSPTPCEFGKYVCFQRASEEVSAESASLLRVVSMLLENCLPTQLELWSKWVQVRYWGCWYRVVVKICHIGLIRYLVRSLNFTPSLSWAKIPCRYLYVYMLTYNNIYIYIYLEFYIHMCV